MALHTGRGRTIGAAIRKIIDYVENPEKTNKGRLISAYQCNVEIADNEFAYAKRQYKFRTGRKRDRDDVIAYQVRQSFRPGEITPEEANRLGVEMARRFTRGNHAFIVCTHVDKKHIHNHIIWNSTTLDCERKFRDFRGSAKAVRRLSDTICIENGYSVIETPKASGKAYNKWLGNAKKPCHRDDLRAAIDRALEREPADMEALFAFLREAGIQVWRRGKSVNLKATGWDKAAKKAFDELGLKKLPTVKSLQAEYAELLAEKKRAYSEYRSARDEMQNLQMARANVARIMGYDNRMPTIEKKQKPHSHDTR